MQDIYICNESYIGTGYINLTAVFVRERVPLLNTYLSYIKYFVSTTIYDKACFIN
jgi:hypothetical protein